MLVFGSSGQVARELRTLRPEATFLSRADADLATPSSCYEKILDARPFAVVNAAAYTAVDKAEGEPSLANRINAEAPAAMARACAELEIPFVHISTDYVFDGEGTCPFAPGDETAPKNVYGRSKELGEQLVRASGATHAIFRTSWVFSPYGQNFPKTMLKLFQSKERLTVVSDQVGGPTPARAIAEACVTAMKALVRSPELSGTYHLSGYPDTSWSDFARTIAKRFEASTEIVDILTREFPTPAKRPLNSRLDCSSLSKLGLQRPEWEGFLGELTDKRCEND